MEPEQTAVSLLYHIESRLADQERAVALAHQVLDARLVGMNEFREQLDRERKDYVRRIELEVVAVKVRDLELSRAELAGKASQASVNVAMVLAALALAVSIAKLFL